MKAYFYGYLYIPNQFPNKYGFKLLSREVNFYYATPEKMNGKKVELLRQGEDEINDVVECDEGQVEFLWIGDFIYGNFMKSPVFEDGDLIRISLDI